MATSEQHWSKDMKFELTCSQHPDGSVMWEYGTEHASFMLGSVKPTKNHMRYLRRRAIYVLPTIHNAASKTGDKR